MANNKSIQILRGGPNYDPSISTEILLDGQPFYSKKNGKFYIGDGESELKQLPGIDIDLNIENEDLIPKEDVVITITSNGYAKRMKQDVYKTQSRGGVGMSGIKTNENDNGVYKTEQIANNLLAKVIKAVEKKDK